MRVPSSFTQIDILPLQEKNVPGFAQTLAEAWPTNPHRWPRIWVGHAITAVKGDSLWQSSRAVTNLILLIVSVGCLHKFSSKVSWYQPSSSWSMRCQEIRYFFVRLTLNHKHNSIDVFERKARMMQCNISPSRQPYKFTIFGVQQHIPRSQQSSSSKCLSVGRLCFRNRNLLNLKIRWFFASNWALCCVHSYFFNKRFEAMKRSRTKHQTGSQFQVQAPNARASTASLILHMLFSVEGLSSMTV